LKHELGAKPYVQSKVPKLTEKQKENCKNFAREHQKWTSEEWKRVLFSDESSFELFHPVNSINDCIWRRNKDDVKPSEVVKFPAKVMVWGMMGPLGLSELHFIPPKTSINAEYYREIILKKCLVPASNRTSSAGSILERKMSLDMSKVVFMQDEATCHTAKINEKWLSDNIPHYWGKGTWPGNSPDLNPIENLWSILQQLVDQVEPPPTTLEGLKKILLDSWKKIKPETLENLYLSMPDQIKSVLNASGGHVCK